MCKKNTRWIREEVPVTQSCSSREWLSIAVEAITQTDGSPEAIVSAIEQKVGSLIGPAKPMAMAFAAGLAELAQYAAATLDETWTAVEFEQEAIAAARRVVRPLFEARLQQRLDALDRQAVGCSVCPGCQAVAESQGRRCRGWASLLGPVALRRRYAHCERCNQGVAPAQKALGLPDGRFTPRLEEVATMMATTVPHEMACSLVSRICGVELSKKAIEDMTERRGHCLLEQLEADGKQFAPFDDTGLPKDLVEAPPTDPEMGPIDEEDVAYIELDGVIAMTREQLSDSELSKADRKRLEAAKQTKARGGKGQRYEIVGREIKNAVLYRGADCTPESPERGCLLHKRYVSLLGPWTAFVALLWVELARLRFDRARLVVILSDGAEWIRSIAAWLPFDTLLILDLYHVKHRILEVAHLLWGQGSDKARAWAHAQYARIEADQALSVIDALRFVTPRAPKAAEKVDELKNYLRNNLDRMHYPAYRARGLRISSACVESANFHVTGQRLKCQGMRWQEQGAREMAAMRADLFNGRWEARTRQIMAA